MHRFGAIQSYDRSWDMGLVWGSGNQDGSDMCKTQFILENVVVAADNLMYVRKIHVMGSI